MNALPNKDEDVDDPRVDLFFLGLVYAIFPLIWLAIEYPTILSDHSGLRYLLILSAGPTTMMFGACLCRINVAFGSILVGIGSLHAVLFGILLLVGSLLFPFVLLFAVPALFVGITAFKRVLAVNSVPPKRRNFDGTVR